MQEIVILGLGPGGWETLTMGAWQALQEGSRIYLRTSKHPGVQALEEKGIKFTTFDYLYEEKQSFTAIYRCIADVLLEAAQTGGQIVYAVPGHPLVAEESVQILLQEAPERGVELVFVSALSFIDSLLTALKFDPAAGLVILDALSCKPEDLVLKRHTIFMQVYNQMVASDLKLTLLEVYEPDHHAVIICRAGMSKEETVIRVPVAELDHLNNFDYLTSVYLEPVKTTLKSSVYPLDPLVKVMEELLGPDGCPWDREQDHQSLKRYLLEEAYEVIEAIDLQDMNKLKEELGDLLLQIVFHTILAQKRDIFDYNEVIEGITEKMIRRHPHVFGDTLVKDSEEVLVNWEKIKAFERGEGLDKQTTEAKVMDRLNKALPALMLAEHVQKKAEQVGFDWPNIDGAWQKVFEEINELKAACQEMKNIEDELGDLLFAVVNLARFVKVSPEAALMKTIKKFIGRFNYIEKKLANNGIKWDIMDLAGLDKLWKEAKKAGL